MDTASVSNFPTGSMEHRAVVGILICVDSLAPACLALLGLPP
ncbi:MAG: hypothetical protein QE493_04130 [Verrucomicrobiae bacterium]|nr:hypothetical protein [Verrucomicrobiae bacterium]